MVNELDSLIEKLDEKEKDGLKELYLERAETLKLKTRLFLRNNEALINKVKTIDKMEQHRHNLEKSLNKESQLDKTEMEEIKKKYRNAANSILLEDEFNKFTKIINQYQQDLNDFFGQKVILVYVVTDGKTKVQLKEIDEQEAENLYKKGYASGGGGLSSVYKNIDFSNYENKDLNSLDSTYLEVYQRAQLSKDTMKMKNTSMMIIMWKIGKKWEKMAIYNLGDLNEAYAYFVYMQDKYTFKENLEQNVKVYMTNGVAQVDSISGLLRGDISITRGVEKIELAVKSKGASMLGHKQVFKIAEELDKKAPKEIVEYLIKEKLSIEKADAEGKGRRNKMLKDGISKYAESGRNDFMKQMRERIKQK